MAMTQFTKEAKGTDPTYMQARGHTHALTLPLHPNAKARLAGSVKRAQFLKRRFLIREMQSREAAAEEKFTAPRSHASFC